LDEACATRIAPGRVMDIPTPAAEPFNATTVGLRHRNMARLTLPPLYVVRAPSSA
jgi:hypothetical protein